MFPESTAGSTFLFSFLGTEIWMWEIHGANSYWLLIRVTRTNLWLHYAIVISCVYLRLISGLSLRLYWNTLTWEDGEMERGGGCISWWAFLIKCDLRFNPDTVFTQPHPYTKTECGFCYIIASSMLFLLWQVQICGLGKTACWEKTKKIENDKISARKKNSDCTFALIHDDFTIIHSKLSHQVCVFIQHRGSHIYCSTWRGESL